MNNQCVSCNKECDGFCENCEAPLCYGCDSMKYHDVLTCKDEASCNVRCGENEIRGEK